jgi:hypothetical protein
MLSLIFLFWARFVLVFAVVPDAVDDGEYRY